jgi:hypothetical protein
MAVIQSNSTGLSSEYFDEKLKQKQNELANPTQDKMKF